MKKVIAFVLIIFMESCSFSQKVSYFFTSEYSYQDIKIDNSEITYVTIDENKMNKKRC